MNKENNEYLQQHQRLLSENITTPSEKADIIRKCLVHSYTASLNLYVNKILRIILQKIYYHIIITLRLISIHISMFLCFFFFKLTGWIMMQI